MTDSTPNETVDPHLAASMAYLIGFLTGALILWRYREIEFAVFHAWQSILFSVVVGVTIVALSTVPIAGLPLAIVGMVVAAGAWVVLIVQAYRGRWTMLPLLGDIAYERTRSEPRHDRTPKSR